MKALWLILASAALLCCAAEHLSPSTNRLGEPEQWVITNQLGGELLRQMLNSLHERGFTNITEADLRSHPCIWATNMFRVHAALPPSIFDWPAPEGTASNQMAGVRSFVQKHGWSMHRREPLLLAVAKEQITGLPWPQISARSFSAVTHDGILYVVLSGFGSESVGVAWNPKTNQFPSFIGTTKALGGNWHAWKQP
jgi:hypothetical protein